MKYSLSEIRERIVEFNLEYKLTENDEKLLMQLLAWMMSKEDTERIIEQARVNENQNSSSQIQGSQRQGGEW